MAMSTRISKRMHVWLATGLVSMGVAASLPTAFGQPSPNPANDMARVEDLKNQAFEALRAGKFDQTTQLLGQAEAMSKDPALAQMSGWVADYRARIDANNEARKKEFDAAIENIKKLQAAGLESFASDQTAAAFLHAADKEEFRNEAWVRQSIDRMAELAAAAEAKGDLLGARRLYTDLSTIEILNPTWRNKFDEMSRKLELVSMYAPDSLDAIYKTDTAERLKVLAIVDPERAAKATTKPADDDLNDDFRIDWKQVLQGVKVDMLREALEDARQNYYRETSFTQLVTGGIEGLSELLATPGLERTFPAMGDPGTRKAFADALEKIKADVTATDSVKDHRIVSQTLAKLLDANRTTVGMPEEVVIYEFANGATNVLDPFTNMIWPFKVNEFRKDTQGRFIGVGIQIDNDEDGYLKVVSPLPDSPAYRAGIHADDIVTQINGKNAKGVTTLQAIKAITGPAGSPVKLTVRSPDGNVKEYNLTRTEINVASVKGWKQEPGGAWEYLIDPDSHIGYVRLTNFTRDSDAEIRHAIDQIQDEGGKAIILDLRNNPGGLLTAATQIADKFLSSGNIVSTRSAKNIATAPPVNARATSDDTDLPTIVLVNQFSASASEIVSGALKDQKRALIVGQRTYGKGSVQQIFPLEGDEAFVKITTSHYYLPSGRCLHREENSTEWGVDPDLAVEMTPEQMRAVMKMRQELDVIRDQPEANPTTLPAEFKTREDQLLASDPQLGAAILMLRMKLLGAPLM